MGEVVTLTVQTKLDLTPERVLQGALDECLKDAVVIGFDRDENLYFASSSADVTIILWLLEKAKQRLLMEGDDGET
jgi:hypothetical protein